MRIRLPEQVKNIIETIEAAGFEAYAVGGCVRDSLLGRIPNDWDITTSARPQEVKALFERTIDTGLIHGTVTVMLDHVGYEVTTYRIDGEYEDCRHPKEVSFTSNLSEDLKRRDFTINAMAYNERSGLVDIFEGMEDIRRKTIRAVGEPMERFSEDALRMMRAVRFAAQLDYQIDEETKQAILRLAPTLSKISAERIQTELVKLLTSPHPELFRILYETQITAVILPEFDAAMQTGQNNPHHCYSVGEHILHSISGIGDKEEHLKVLRLTMLCHDLGKAQTKTTDSDGVDHFHGHAAVSADMAENILKRLKFDNDTVNKVRKLVFYHDYRIEPCKKTVRRAIHKIGEELFPLLLLVERADLLAQSEYQRAQKCERLKMLQILYREILEEKQCLSLKDLAVKGVDLIGAGVMPGREIGAILERMLERVLDEPDKNEKDYLLGHLDEFRGTL
ncbi:MAG: CCA tRNA nucleotidyltransferase [Lachnospiraceae bacterium]|nr:CCA tRNA nucleotidyltransferase [Lachnospiraceae bacterium]